MHDESIFVEMGFDSSLRSVFLHFCEFIRSKDGCNAHVYRLRSMKEVRASHIPPVYSGKNRAQQVFLMIRKRGNAIVLLRRRRFRLDKPKEQWEILMGSDFSDWSQLKKIIKLWSLDPKLPAKPKIRRDFGDGIALPGGRPESNRSKF